MSRSLPFIDEDLISLKLNRKVEAIIFVNDYIAWVTEDLAEANIKRL
jgi:hypothetical protein